MWPVQAARVVVKQKYTSPEYLLSKAACPGGSLRIDFNAWRFVAILAGKDSAWTKDQIQQEFTRAFINRPWADALSLCHSWLWNKYGILPPKVAMFCSSPQASPKAKTSNHSNNLHSNHTNNHTHTMSTNDHHPFAQAPGVVPVEVLSGLESISTSIAPPTKHAKTK
jgi:hypothetical protein